MTVALLDVNVLIALADSAHIDHARADVWFERHADEGWATCPITENGVIRILSSSGYANRVSTATARNTLRDARSVGRHEFWPCDVSLLDDSVVHGDRLHGPRQVTDASLAALAVAHDGTFVTFDRSIVRSAVVRATAASITVL